MKRIVRVIVSAAVVSSLLSGCIIWPGWDDDEGYHHGHHEHGDWHRGEYERR